MRHCRSAPLGLVLLLGAVGCSEGGAPTESAHPGNPLLAVFDGLHGGTEGFYFLPPMVSNPGHGGTFDAGLQPVVEICETTTCAAVHASYSMTDGVGSEVVRLSAEHHYMVNWHTRETGAAAGHTYRVRVRVNSVLLGYANVTVVSTARAAAELRSVGAVALVANQTLPVKFRIETGIVGAVMVSPATANVGVGETQQFTAELQNLHGEPLVGPTVTWSSAATSVATVAANGLATGVADGSATITASAGPASGTAVLTVSGAAVAATWQPMGQGMDNAVLSLTVYDGDLIAGGSFTTADGESANRVARWNGSAWEPLGSGTNGLVYALTVFNGDLIVAGEFTTAGGQPASRIARWDGSSWYAIGSGMTSSRVRGLAVYNGDLIAAGGFAGRVVRWNGLSWQPMGTGINNEAVALVVSGTELIVSGFFTSAGGQTVNRIARWNGSDWEAMSTGMNDRVFGLTFFENAPVAGGWFTTASGQSAPKIARWNGSTWESIGSGITAPPLSVVDDLATYRGDLIAAGVFTHAGGLPANNVARWDGSAWHPLGAGMNNRVSAAITHGDYLFVGGFFDMADGQTANRVARWGAP